jgi:beta-galactosidase
VADGKDLAYITVRMVDKDGNLCPMDQRNVHIKVTGAATCKASANGDPTCLNLFHLPEMPLFSGQLTAIVQTGEKGGDILIEARAKGVNTGKLSIKAE